MKKYKVCPSCHKKNEPVLLECICCEADLTRVKITDEETEKIMEANIDKLDTPEVRLIRICECGAVNPSNARKCSSCNEDISDIAPTPGIQQQTGRIEFVLSSLDGQYVYKITTDELIIGRQNVMSDYLSHKSYVSRAHAKFIVQNGSLFIENLSNTNFTYVNNNKISERVRLEVDDEIGLGGTNHNGKSQSEAAYFLVRTNQCM